MLWQVWQTLLPPVHRAERGCVVAGVQAEHCPGQWSYRVGPCQGVDLADQLWLSRYLLLRVSESCGFKATLDPNPLPGDWAGQILAAGSVDGAAQLVAGAAQVSSRSCAARVALLPAAEQEQACGFTVCSMARHACSSPAAARSACLYARPQTRSWRSLTAHICGLGQVCQLLQPSLTDPACAGTSAPVRFSTWETRQPGSGMAAISAHMTKLSCAHLHHMMLYGQRTSRRYSGELRQCCGTCQAVVSWLAQVSAPAAQSGK